MLWNCPEVSKLLGDVELRTALPLQVYSSLISFFLLHSFLPDTRVQPLRTTGVKYGTLNNTSAIHQSAAVACKHTEKHLNQR